MAKLTVAKVAKRCLEVSEQLKPQLDDPRLQDLRVSIEQARSALAAGQLPRWQVKRLVDTVALAAMLAGKAKLAEQVFGLWMKAGQSISQNPASLVLEAIPDLGKKSAGEGKRKTRPAPAPPPETPAQAATSPVAPASSQPGSQPGAPENPAPAPAPAVSGQFATSHSYPPDSFASPEGGLPQVNPAQPAWEAAPEITAPAVDNTQSLGMGLAAMVSAAYAAENGTAENPPATAEVIATQNIVPASQPGEAEPVSDQGTPAEATAAAEPADSARADWSAPRGQMPWLPVQRPAPAPEQRTEAAPDPVANTATAASSPVKTETSPANVLASKSEFPPRRSLVRRDSSPQLPVPASNQMRLAPSPPLEQPLPSAEPPKPAVPPQPAVPPANPSPTAAPAAAAEVMPTAAAPESTPVEPAFLDDAAIWDYFQKMGFDSKLNMSFEEFVARKNHTVASNNGTESILAAQPAAQPKAPRSAFAEVADEMPASLLVAQSEASELSLSPAESALRRAAQSPLAPSRVPPAAPHKPREILADADRQPSTRLITIRVRGYFDYQPRFTRPKQRLDEPAVAGSTTSFAKSIISAEGPMPLEFLARRLCQKYRIEYHDQRPEEISRCLGPALRLISEPGMRTVWPAGVDPLNWNTALQSPIGLPRKLESLTLTEVVNALRWQISRTNSMERTEIIGEAFKLLYGISPVTPQVVELADRAISYGIGNNLLAAGDGTLWLP
ncbi:hypothetical protein [uncultured Varibaculum sp.]|uniref:hypothetical protein n=1 Tax=uncultured Varibaculum sp. TaxID=413896 RepID=UPI00288ABA09|nr:hypothetical protein [uncultured Varibaculum sp.]